MLVLLLFCFLLLCVAALVVLLRARRLAARAARLSADPLETRSSFPTVAVAAARHMRTMCGHPPTDACLPELPPGIEGTLGITDHELTWTDMAGERAIAHARVMGVSLLARFEGVAAGRSALLQVEWRRGGERLRSVFALENRREAERMRREIHLRARGGQPAPQAA